MWKIIRQAGYMLIIIMLLPYIITVFMNGSEAQQVPYVVVKKDGEEKRILLEEYGIGMLAKEIDPQMEKETVKAQAVIIRTNIYKMIQEKGSESVLTMDYWTRTQMKQIWGSERYGEWYEKLKSSWKDTEGEVLLYENKLILAPYHQLSNGKTRVGNEVFQTEEYPYLKAKECKADEESDMLHSTSIIDDMGFAVTKYDSSGYVAELKKGDVIISGEEFRDTYHLISACFSLEEFDNKTKVLTRGIGHGLGMSQNCANDMAMEGKGYRDILAYFYDGIHLQEVAEIIVQKNE